MRGRRPAAAAQIRRRDTGPRENTLVCLYEALRSGRVPDNWAGLARLAAGYGSGLGVTAADITAVRSLTVEEFALAVLTERRAPR